MRRFAASRDARATGRQAPAPPAQRAAPAGAACRAVRGAARAIVPPHALAALAARAGAALLLAFAAGGTPARAAEDPPMLARDSSGTMRWNLAAPPQWPPTAIGLVARQAVLRAGAADTAGLVAGLRVLAGHAALRPYALRRLGAIALARGDTARADSCWRAVDAVPGMWQWDLVRARVDLARARGELARAESLLARPGREEWLDADRAESMAYHADLRLARADTAGAIALARQALEAYPGAPASPPLAERLDAWLAARGEASTVRDEQNAALVVRLAPDRPAAVERHRLALDRLPAGDARAALALQLGELLRRLRRYRDARELLRPLAAPPADGARRAAALVALARIERDAGQRLEAYNLYARAARIAPPGHALRETAWWERAREEEESGEWRAARRDYGRAWALGGSRNRELAFRAGLLWFAAGDNDSARTWWSRADGEGAEFWLALASRRLAPPVGDSLLGILGARPSYSFYVSAARDTLGAPPPVGRAAETVTAAFPPVALRLATVLIEIGWRDEAREVLERYAARDPAASGRGGPRRETPEILKASRLAYCAGAMPLGIRFAGRAFERAPEEEGAWSRLRVAPWRYPPAFDSLFATWPERAPPGGADRALLRAVAWQESHFDPAARSRAGAVGLLQLMPATAARLARTLGEPRPAEATLRDPVLSLRYGGHLLERLLARFGGRVPAALAAYNAGPDPATRWSDLAARGGDALLCELIAYSETRGYVKNILAVRSAYEAFKPVDSGR
ncbi:MAG: hypothetical protein A2W00_11735 [Candidatus Eisenbacteria bacterium RBG_16_71_46]|nr:MAG: hypothetical protein A2W00_11735 [Candidatus Eisenbacteria bacterium RBG_16_71_46]